MNANRRDDSLLRSALVCLFAAAFIAWLWFVTV